VRTCVKILAPFGFSLFAEISCTVRTGDTDGASIVQKALNDQKLGVRGLARRLAGKNAAENEIQRWRRAIYRVLDDRALTPPIAEAMEVALKLPAGCLPRYEPRRRGNASVLGRAELTAALEELEGTVSSLEAAVEELERRVVALEHPPAHGASERA
jgi:hypothetical protein